MAFVSHPRHGTRTPPHRLVPSLSIVQPSPTLIMPCPPLHHPGGYSRALVFTNELSTRGTVHGDAMRARIRRSRPTLASRGVHARSGRAHGTEGSGMERRNAQFAVVRVRVDAWIADEGRWRDRKPGCATTGRFDVLERGSKLRKVQIRVVD